MSIASIRRSPPATGVFLIGALLSGCGGPPTETYAPVTEAAMPGVALGAFAYVTVGTADLDAALGLWRDRFGLEVAARREGPDAALARLWDMPADDVARQALLRTPGVRTGGLHLVEFTRPGAPVREGAAVFDRVPKNLDVYATDLPARYDELRAAGLEFRAPWVEMPGPGGLAFREVQMPGHDATNIVLLEILQTDYRYSPAGYAGIGPLIVVVGNAAAETAFYQEVLGLRLIMEDLLAGPEIERMVGLPAGAGIDFRVLGAEDDPMGRIEVVEYQRTGGADLFSRARAPATGTLHAGWQVESLAALLTALDARGIAYRQYGQLETIVGRGPMISFQTPAGFRIEVQEVPLRHP
jgi:catechol 2,3-dioxygenase-like lactoylglutathione lyase family enzyme